MQRQRHAGMKRLMLLAALLGAGCATGPALRNATAVFTVSKVGTDCPGPTSMEPGKRNCSAFLSSREDCVRVDRKAKNTIVIQAVEGVKDYFVYFQPGAPLRSERGRVVVELDSRTPAKEYSFGIAAPDCKDVDPSIIVEW